MTVITGLSFVESPRNWEMYPWHRATNKIFAKEKEMACVWAHNKLECILRKLYI